MNTYPSQERKNALRDVVKSFGATSLHVIPVRVCDHCKDDNREAFPCNFMNYDEVLYRNLCVECYVALSADPTNDWEPVCEICGSSMEWEDCYNCMNGYIDLHDEDPLWYDADDFERCDTCNGDTGWWYCPNASDHSWERSHETKI